MPHRQQEEREEEEGTVAESSGEEGDADTG